MSSFYHEAVHLNNVGVIALSNGNYAFAIESMTKAIKLLKSDISSIKNTSISRQNRGVFSRRITTNTNDSSINSDKNDSSYFTHSIAETNNSSGRRNKIKTVNIGGPSCSSCSSSTWGTCSCSAYNQAFQLPTPSPVIRSSLSPQEEANNAAVEGVSTGKEDKQQYCDDYQEHAADHYFHYYLNDDLDAYISAVIYNLALAHQLMASLLSSSSATKTSSSITNNEQEGAGAELIAKAEKLYSITIKMIDQKTSIQSLFMRDMNNGQEDHFHISTLVLLRLACMNNLHQITKCYGGAGGRNDKNHNKNFYASDCVMYASCFLQQLVITMSQPSSSLSPTSSSSSCLNNKWIQDLCNDSDIYNLLMKLLWCSEASNLIASAA